MKAACVLVVTFILGCQLQAQVVFNLSSSPGVGSAPDSIAVADVNGDGKLDLICANYYGNSLSVLTNNGIGGFVLSGTYPVGGYPEPVIAADVNKDGKPDLICANGLDSTLSVLTNNGSGGFALAGTYPVSNPPTSVIAADLNGDGNVDLIDANWGSGTSPGNTLTIFTNDGTGKFAVASSPVVDSNPYAVAAVDINGNGKLALICASWGHNIISVLTNNGSGGFGLSSTNVVGNQPKWIVTADVNGDGKMDLITANWNNGSGNTLTVLTNNGNGGFALDSSPVVGAGSISLAAADVNGDGKVDLISANVYANTLTVLTNNGSGGFVLATNLPAGTPNAVTAADVNGDGKADLISANGGNNTLSVFTNATVFPNLCGPVATGSAFETNGFVVSVVVICGGSGYTNTPAVHFIGGGGSGAQAFATVSNGVVTSIRVVAAGSGYTNAPLVVIDPPFIPNPVLGINPISFLSFSNLSPGITYQLQQMFLGSWTNQFNSFTATNGLYTQAVPGAVSNGGYRLVLSPAPAQAFATAQVLSGFVIGATVTSPGSGYVSVPAVAIVGGGGSGATAIAQISAGAVTNIMITATGSGYTSPPTIQIAPPPVAALTPAIAPGMQVNSTNLIPYYSYQLEFTPNLPAGWTNWDGGLFTPSVATNAQFLIISNSAGFFRLKYLGTP
jgi:hypothetical protein